MGAAVQTDTTAQNCGGNESNGDAFCCAEENFVFLVHNLLTSAATVSVP